MKVPRSSIGPGEDRLKMRIHEPLFLLCQKKFDLPAAGS